MNDRELERLIRMAHEAEELERSALVEASPLRLVGGGARRWVTGLGIGAAAAASLLGAIVVMHQSMGPVPAKPVALRDPKPSAPVPQTPEQAIAKAEPDQCMVLAVYRGADGKCSCLQLNEHEWGGRSLADVPKQELLDVAMREACSTDAHQVLVVAVEDKADALPRSREEAEAIAARLSEAPSGRVSDVSSYAYAAMPTLSPGATVVAERVAVRPSGPMKLVNGVPAWNGR